MTNYDADDILSLVGTIYQSISIFLKNMQIDFDQSPSEFWLVLAVWELV